MASKLVNKVIVLVARGVSHAECRGVCIKRVPSWNKLRFLENSLVLNCLCQPSLNRVFRNDYLRVYFSFRNCGCVAISIKLIYVDADVMIWKQAQIERTYEIIEV